LKLPNSSRATVAARLVQRGEELYRFSGRVQREMGTYTLQVGREAHIAAVEPDEPWLFMNHSFSPTVAIAHECVTTDKATLKVIALVDLECGDCITFDYTLHEWEMSCPFTCEETGRNVCGWVGLSEAEQDTSMPNAMPHIKTMYLQHLFGQSSRC
jgi:hypothetical protein